MASRIVEASVSVVNMGIGINMEYHGLEGDHHTSLLRCINAAAGAANPATVWYERNKRGQEGKKVDWNMLRISNDQCQASDIIPSWAITQEQQLAALQEAVAKIVVWMRGTAPAVIFMIRFRVAGTLGDEDPHSVRAADSNGHFQAKEESPI